MSLSGQIAVSSENRDFRDRFADRASAYRRRVVQLRFVLVPLLLAFWYVVFFAPAARMLGVLAFVTFFVALVFSKRTMPKLICPACERDTDGEILRFCPECGSHEVLKKGDDKYFLLWPQCKACGKKPSRRKGHQRLYKIRFCTRCGAHLDERGV